MYNRVMPTVTRQDLEARLSQVSAQVRNPEHGIWGPDSMLWKVNRESAMFIGGARALMLQLAYPTVAKSVSDHSRMKEDPFGRFRRTFEATHAMVYGNMESAFKSARAVHNVHTRITGSMGGGNSYHANDEDALFWVHSTLWETSILMYETFVGELTLQEKEKYYQETKLFAYLFGISDDVIPETYKYFVRYNKNRWDFGLKVTSPALNISESLFAPIPQLKIPGILYRSVTKALLPPQVAEEYGMTPSALDKSNLSALRYGVRKLLPHLPNQVRYHPKYLSAMKACRRAIP